ncbi:hypothetical protein EUGRSUZ_E00178 [Eucalyptus grandis]|uniref:Uncharacterized protein n=2 Tax=Eucalyptus grandis TaxID=71139 RepID=A0ACC3KQY3_EUCGR|nr:hypothetical protein EUGRSUZ_E00178 [Eucalyptus grandis]
MIKVIHEKAQYEYKALTPSTGVDLSCKILDPGQSKNNLSRGHNLFLYTRPLIILRLELPKTAYRKLKPDDPY